MFAILTNCLHCSMDEVSMYEQIFTRLTTHSTGHSCPPMHLNGQLRQLNCYYCSLDGVSMYEQMV